jgi:hypothetical protein
MKKSMPSDHTNGMTDDHFMLAQLLRDIPANEAQPLLIKHWGYLKFSPLFVQAALYIGSPQCVELAAAAIGDYPSNIDPLKFLGDFFGFFVTGLMDRVEHRHLEVLLPYLGRLDDSTLWYMAEFCERRGQRDWALQHLKPECDRRRAQLLQIGDSSKAYVERLGQHHFPSDADLRQELDRIERLGARHFANVYHWSEEFERRQDDHMRWQRILSEWFASNPTIERFRLFANAMSEHGTRKDIDLLYEHEISGDPDEIEQLRTSARIGIMRRSLQ